VERLIDFLDTDGFPAETAVLTQDDLDRWRLYLVPKERSETDLKSTIKVAWTLSNHADELPDRDELLFSVVAPDHPIIKAIKTLKLGRVKKRRKVEGVYGGDHYIDRAYVFRLN
jgi:hypothetical protein